jgi:hypothetical protein
MAGAFAGLLVGCGGLLVLLFVSALLLRAAAATANRIVGPPREDEFEFGDWDDWDSDEPPRRRRRQKASVPEPGVGKGMLAAFAAWFATALTGMVLAVTAEEVFGDVGDGAANAIALSILATPVGFGVLALLLAGLLPTTFWRGALVAFLYYLFAFVIVTAVVCTIAGCFAFAGR